MNQRRYWRRIFLALAALATARASDAASPSISLDYSSTVIPVSYVEGNLIIYFPDGPGGTSAPQHLAGTSARWTSDDPSVVSINRLTGQMTGASRGTATITATYQGMTASAQIKVAGTLNSETIATADGRTRSYLLYIPDGLSSGPYPLVLAFHGGGGQGKDQMRDSQMDVTADADGFLVAYPDGIGGTWNAGTCCGIATTLHIDDVGFVSQLIDQLVADNGVDPARVYSTGLSNGAILSHRLACELTDKIAAIAPVSGGLNVGGDFESCNPSHPVPILEFHGTSDDNYPYLGGFGVDAADNIYKYPIPSSVDPSTINDWLAMDGIDPARSKIVYQNGIETCELYGPPLGVTVTLCTAQPPVKLKTGQVVWDGAGHAWPGGVWSPSANADVPTQDINASDKIWKFFSSIDERNAIRQIVEDAVILDAVRDAIIRRAIEDAVIREAVEEAVIDRIVEDAIIRQAVRDAIARRAKEVEAVREEIQDELAEEAAVSALIRSAAQDAIVRDAVLSASVR